MIISPANSISVNDAISAVRNVEASGGTDILRGFEKCFELLEPYFTGLQLEEGLLSLILFKVGYFNYLKTWKV